MDSHELVVINPFKPWYTGDGQLDPVAVKSNARIALGIAESMRKSFASIHREIPRSPENHTPPENMTDIEFINWMYPELNIRAVGDIPLKIRELERKIWEHKYHLGHNDPDNSTFYERRERPDNYNIHEDSMFRISHEIDFLKDWLKIINSRTK